MYEEEEDEEIGPILDLKLGTVTVQHIVVQDADDGVYGELA